MLASKHLAEASNARINPRRAQAFNLHPVKHHEKDAIEASAFDELLGALSKSPPNIGD
jgi:hypothetical protein